MADIVQVFMEAGIDAVYGVTPDAPDLIDAIKDAEDRTGRKCIRISIPSIDTQNDPDGWAATERILDAHAACGTDILMPHQNSTDALVDRRAQCIRNIDPYLAMIRDRGMIPGLSTHMPETIAYADAAGLDVATYIQIYNAAGFLMQVEVDWVHRIIWEARKPVIVIKPLAAGRLQPLVGLAFVWGTLREQDMVTVGTMSVDEAAEIIEYSLALLERRKPELDLQRTRSKASIEMI